MKQYFDKDNKYVELLRGWKHSINMVPYDYNAFLEVFPDKVYASLKIDGEGTLFVYENNTAKLISREGRIREDFPVTKNLETVLKKHNKVIGFGELYVVDENGKVLEYPQASSVLRKPTPETEKNIRFAIYDIYSVDGKEYKDLPYKERYDEIVKIIPDGAIVHPVDLFYVDKTKFIELWEKYVKSGMYEGLVVHTTDKVYKIKPIITQDVAVIFVEKSQKHDYMGSLGMAYYEKDKFYFAGKVGTGFSVSSRYEWLEYGQNNKLREDKNVLWVKPEKVIEVAAKSFNFRNVPIFDKNMTAIGEDKGAVMREPKFIRERIDKTIQEEDIGFYQIPEFKKQSGLNKFSVSDVSELKHPDTKIIKPNEFYPNGLTEKDIWTYYNTVKKELIKGIKDFNVLLKKVVDHKQLIIRKEYGTDKFINIPDIKTFDKYNDGRTVEFHIVVGNKSKIAWVDLDPNENYPWRNVIKVALAIEKLFKNKLPVKNTKIMASGGRGIYVVGYLHKEYPVDTLRNNLIELLDAEIVPTFDNVTVRKTDKKDEMRLDVSTLHNLGSIRAEWSLNANTGLVCKDIRSINKSIDFIERKDFTIDKLKLKAFKLLIASIDDSVINKLQNYANSMARLFIEENEDAIIYALCVEKDTDKVEDLAEIFYKYQNFKEKIEQMFGNDEGFLVLFNNFLKKSMENLITEILNGCSRTLVSES